MDDQDLHVYLLEKKHAPDIYLIEKKSFTRPWSKASIAQIFETRNYSGMGIFLGKVLIGYCLFYAVLDEINILNLAITPAYRNQKYGAYLIEFLKSWSKENKYKKIYLEVSVENTAAQKLYQNAGFSKKSRRLRYYRDGQDAFVMEKVL